MKSGNTKDIVASVDLDFQTPSIVVYQFLFAGFVGSFLVYSILIFKFELSTNAL